MTKRQQQRRHENYLTRGFAKRFRQENREAFRELWLTDRRNRKSITLRNKHGKPFKISYAEYIASPQWEKRKELYYKKYKRQCVICGTTSHVTLHHRSYKRIGNERDRDLVPLCWTHHSLFHERRGKGQLHNETDTFIISQQEAEEARLISKHI